MNITIKNIPDSLHYRLKDKASKNGRSLNKEIISTLETTVFPQKVKSVDFLEQVRKKREHLKLRLTIDTIESAIHNGRA